MKTIKLFLASSEELYIERLEFSDLILQLNDLFERRDLKLKIVKWEHHDASMSVKHKQQEYNDKLKECEICLTLYWTKFGSYTAEELDVAYSELKEGRNPRKLYVFFKSAEQVTPELQEFKESFATKYGHFFCKFENVDTMRLQFLLQLETYQNDTADRLLKVENQKILVDDTPMVDLNNVPFAAMNSEFCRLRDGITKADRRIEKCRKRLLDDPEDEDLKEDLDDYLSERNTLQEELDRHQGFLFDMARKTSQLSSHRLSERSAEAIRLFNEGKAAEANAILNTEDMERDTQQSFNDFNHHTELAKQARERIELIYNDWLLKVDTTLSDETKAIEERISEAESAYKQAKLCALQLDYNESEKERYASLLSNYAHFCGKYALYQRAIEIYSDYISIIEELYGFDNRITIDSYEYMGGLYKTLHNKIEAVNYLKKAILGYSALYGSSYYISVGLSIRAFYLLDDEETLDSAIEECISNIESTECDIVKLYEYLLQFLQEKFIKESLFILNPQTIADRYKELLQSHSSSQSRLEVAERSEKIAYLLNIIAAERGINGEYIKDREQRDLLLREAIGYCMESISLKSAIFGSMHPDLIAPYRIFAELQMEISSNQEALLYLEKAIDIKLQTVGRKHPDTASLLIRKASLLYYSNIDKELAIGIYHQAEEIYNRLNMQLTADAAYCNESIGYIYFHEERYETSLRYFLKYMRGCTESMSQLFRSRQLANSVLEILYKDSVKEFRFLEAFDTIAEELGDRHLYFAMAYDDIAQYYIAKEEYSSALDYLNKSLDIKMDMGLDRAYYCYMSEYHLYTNIVNCYLALNKPQQAIEYLHKDIDYGLKFGDSRGLTKDAYKRLGEIHSDLSDYSSAIQHYLTALEIDKRASSSSPYFQLDVYEKMVDLYDRLAEPTKVVEYLEKSLLLQEQTIGADHRCTLETKEQIEVVKSKFI